MLHAHWSTSIDQSMTGLMVKCDRTDSQQSLQTLGLGNLGRGLAVQRAYIDYDTSKQIMRMDAMR